VASGQVQEGGELDDGEEEGGEEGGQEEVREEDGQAQVRRPPSPMWATRRSLEPQTKGGDNFMAKKKATKKKKKK
jgi:hypothetical protein